MLDDRDEKRGVTLSFDPHRWLPYILIVAGWLIGYGRDSSGTEALRTKVAEDHTTTEAISQRLGDLSVHMARVEATLEEMKRQQDQDRVLRQK